MSNVAQYNTLTFVDVFGNVDKFLGYYKNSYLPKLLQDDSIKTIYYLLYARYGNNPIANRDKNQFIHKLFSVIFQYGPTREKRLDLQDRIRNLPEKDLIEGSKQIMNHALNPSSDPSVQSMEELIYINEQNTSNFKRSKIEALRILWDSLRTDVTENFLLRFRELFKAFALPERRVLYSDDCEGDIEEWNN